LFPIGLKEIRPVWDSRALDKLFVGAERQLEVWKLLREPGARKAAQWASDSPMERATTDYRFISAEFSRGVLDHHRTLDAVTTLSASLYDFGIVILIANG
jgi:hypothetical protein